MPIQRIRAPAVAGRFYPAQALELERMVEQFLQAGRGERIAEAKAVVAPHAGYIFSGPVAGSAFRNWVSGGRIRRRIVLLGPSHHVAFPGIALPESTAFATPLGSVQVDGDGVDRLRGFPQVHELGIAHKKEHGLEVELPFLQGIVSDLAIVPLLVGEATDREVYEVIEALWGDEETRFVISSDLSHYHDYATAQGLDQSTATAIEGGLSDKLSADRACGYLALRGFLLAARQHGLGARTLDLRNSGDTAGPRYSVVGYGAFGFAAGRN